MRMKAFVIGACIATWSVPVYARITKIVIDQTTSPAFCIIFGFPKLRSTLGHKSMVIKSLEERVGQEAFVRYMRPDAPRGPIDVLKTPELLERARKA